MLLFGCFSNPPSPPWDFSGLVPCAASFHLKFKGVTRGSAIKDISLTPLSSQVHAGAAGRLAHPNNLGNLVTGTPIWSPQGKK